MDIITISRPVHLLCIPVPTFPHGIKESFDVLVDQFGFEKHVYYGISYMDSAGRIIYKVAVSVDGPGNYPRHYEEFDIPAGWYLSITLFNWMSRPEKMKDLFEELMQDSRFDDTFPCVEWYKSDEEVLCMVKARF